MSRLLKKIRIEVDNKQAVQALRETNNEQKKVVETGTKGTDSVGDSFRRLLPTLTAAAGAYKAIRFVTQEVNLATEQFLEKEGDYVRLANAVEIAGGSWMQLEGSIRATLSTMQATTRFSDNELARSLTTLTILTGDARKAQENLALTADMGASGLFNIETAARYVSMALEGNYTMLSRYLPALRTLDKDMGEAATQTEKVNAAMQILRDTFGGMAEKEMKATSVQLQALTNRLNDLRAMMGPGFAALQQAMLSIYVGVYERVAELLGAQVEENDKINEFTQTQSKLSLEVLRNQERILENVYYQIAAKDELSRKEEEIAQQYLKRLLALRNIIQSKEIELAEDNKIRAEQERIANIVSGVAASHREIRQQVAETAREGINAYITDEQLDNMVKYAQLTEWTRQQYLSEEQKIKEAFAERIELAMEAEDVLLAMQLQQLEAVALLKERHKELTDAQMTGANLAADVLYEAMGGAFDNIERMFVNMIKRMIAEALVLAAIMQLTGNIPGTGFNLGRLLFPGRADGGSVQKGKPYIVGEEGHELFVPTQNGYIFPHETTQSILTQPISPVHNTTNILNTSKLESLLLDIKNAIYGTALTDVTVARSVERGNLARAEL